ncbi:hypothetical protein TRAPUB_9545 [Trametes pubescens]|uniref:Uncharacterized protein n=1 Tax=Trametes pubescens TaxID=154538 RepID=A0A1M2W243_TRAPU|nr:hypothetical protein TRAPUB_9545 [Trametes pubescens]
MAELAIDILYHIANLMDILTLQSWRRTCMIADCTGSLALGLRYNAALGTFFNDPTMFRNVLRLTSSVMSGSTALHILDVACADTWSPTDLDIYAPSYSARQLITYIRDVEGYNIVKENTTKYPYHDAGLTHVFWGTHVMNYLTADSFCMAYPELTLTGRALLNPIQLIDLQHPKPFRTIQAISTFGRDTGATWKFSPDNPIRAVLSLDNKPCDIKVVCVLRNVILEGRYPRIAVLPLYHWDAIIFDSLIRQPYAVGLENEPLRKRQPVVFSLRPGNEPIVITDSTNDVGKDASCILLPELLHPADLVVADINVFLNAPVLSVPNYVFSARRIALIHTAEDQEAGLTL